MKIEVKFYAGFRELFGGREKEVELADGSNIQNLLDLLCNSHEQRQKIYDDAGGLRHHVNIMLKSGRKVRFLRELKAELQDGDVVSIFPSICGG